MIILIIIIIVVIIYFLFKYKKIENFGQYNICNLPGETCELGMCSISGKPCAINDLSNVGKCKTCPLQLTKIPPGYCFIWDGYADNNGKPCSGNNRENGCQNCSTGIFLPSAHCGTFPCK
jgi:hypothetical protein